MDTLSFQAVYHQHHDIICTATKRLPLLRKTHMKNLQEITEALPPNLKPRLLALLVS